MAKRTFEGDDIFPEVIIKKPNNNKSKINNNNKE